LTTKSTRLNNG